VIEETVDALFGEFVPGSALPSEVSYAGARGKRTRFVGDACAGGPKGLIEAKRKIGTGACGQRSVGYPTPISVVAAGVQEPIGWIGELYELRHLTNRLAASLAASNANASDIRR